MVLEIDGWQFEADTVSTAAYSDQEAGEHCDCGYCRNFYAAVDQVYPGLRTFLGRFGLNIEGPDELIPFEPTLYDASYGVKGRILSKGNTPMNVDGLVVTAREEECAMVDTACPRPCFVLTVARISLPWVLDEPADQVLSPANEDTFMRQVIDRYLERTEENEKTV